LYDDDGNDDGNNDGNDDGNDDDAIDIKHHLICITFRVVSLMLPPLNRRL